MSRRPIGELEALVRSAPATMLLLVLIAIAIGIGLVGLMC